jgi:TonB family protein
MAIFFSGCRTDRALKNALASLGLTMLFLAASSLSIAQAPKAAHSPRKVSLRIEPEYPRILKSAHVGGLVRLSVSVLANGNVAKVETMGGSAILAQSATDAVHRWKYTSASAPTIEEVEIQFNPD